MPGRRCCGGLRGVEGDIMHIGGYISENRAETSTRARAVLLYMQACGICLHVGWVDAWLVF